jgi:3-oxoacyl-[acyl-carrier-protein] synthase II
MRSNHSYSGTDSVVVTGLGAVTPLGVDAKSTWAAMCAGRSGVSALGGDWPAEHPIQIAAKVPIEPAEVLGRIEARRLDRSGQFALIALREAWADAGFVGPARQSGTPLAERVAVVLGSGMGGLGTLLGNYDVMLARGTRPVSPHALPMIMPNGPAGRASLEIGAQAAAIAPTSACATGGEAVAGGLDLIRLGRADVVAVGGTEAIIHPLPTAAFANMMAMSRRNHEPSRASRPFDRTRDGFVMGEGAGVLILESARHARARGARVYCELAGAGLSADAYHIASPDPDGRGMARAARKALADGALRPEDIVHVNAHATSTPQGDLAENRALIDVFGREGYCVSATKSMTGHLIGAAGAVEAIAAVRALCERLAPPTVNVDELDEAIELDIVRDEPRQLPRGRIAVLSNSAGFGGHNAVVVFRSLD